MGTAEPGGTNLEGGEKAEVMNLSVATQVPACLRLWTGAQPPLFFLPRAWNVHSRQMPAFYSQAANLPSFGPVCFSSCALSLVELAMHCSRLRMYGSGYVHDFDVLNYWETHFLTHLE